MIRCHDLGRAALSLAIGLGASIAPAAAAPTAPAKPLIAGLDHVPVAVHDLDQAADDFARLGFVIKPGRPHDDGIRNLHVKFPNGGEIELITASSPTDALAREYAGWLRGPDGPASWSVYAPDLVALTRFLTEHGLAPHDAGDVVTYSQAVIAHRLFFADRLRSPTDGPAYWSHPNTAYRLARVWLAGAPGEVELLERLGATVTPRDACSPFDAHATSYALPGGDDEVAVSPDVHVPQDGSVLGVTVFVKDLSAARRLLDAHGVRHLSPAACGGGALWVGPGDAHGLWLEFATREVEHG